MPTAISHRLVAHPATPFPAIHDLQVAVTNEGQHDQLTLRYLLRGELRLLRCPPRAARARRTDRLWQHTCFEAFIATTPMPSYLEFNFSPSGDWAAYAFAAPRLRRPDHDPGLPVTVDREHDDTELSVTATVPLAALGDCAPGAALGLSAVLQGTDGTLSYWALAHGDGPADFHDPAGWLARLPGEAS